MSPTGNGARQYRVELTHALTERIQALHRVAADQGRAASFRQALRFIIDHLEIDPLACGEPSYPLPALGLTVRTIVRAPLVVHYTVHLPRRLVWFSAVHLLAGG